MEQSRYMRPEPEFDTAFRSIRAGKNFFSMVIAICIVTQLTGFVLVRFVGLLDPLQHVSVQEAATQRADDVIKAMPAVQSPAIGDDVDAMSAPLKVAESWQGILSWILPATKFLAVVSAVILLLILVFGTQLAILERTGGISGFVSASLWGIVLLAMLISWNEVLNMAGEMGGLYTLDAIIAASISLTADSEPIEHVIYYGRFLAVPVVALLVWLVVQVKFSRGFYRSSGTPVVPIPIEAVGEVPLADDPAIPDELKD